MPDPLAVRRREAEWMDEPGADPEQLRRSLAFIRRVNQLLGYTRATLHHLERFSRSWTRGERIEIVDFATGSADIPRAILQWAAKRGFDVRVTGMDLHPTTAAEAVAEGGDEGGRLRVVRGDVLAPPFDAGSFDYAITAMFLHHLDDAAAVRVLATMGRLARRGVIAADLLRHRRAYFWIKLLTLAANPMVRHDAPVSVAQSFSESEVLRMREAAGLEFCTFFRHFGHRWVLAGEKRN